MSGNRFDRQVRGRRKAARLAFYVDQARRMHLAATDPNLLWKEDMAQRRYSKLEEEY